MNMQFNTINDQKYSFISNSDLRNDIIKAGRKKIVFVEGWDDKVIFEILYKEYNDKIRFIDSSLQSSHTQSRGGCEEVKSLLMSCVSKLPNDKRFYGVIDRDLKLDVEIEIEKLKPCYDHRLFIFIERYTLENYFIEINILSDFLHGKSINFSKKLASKVNDREQLKTLVKNIIDEILECLIKIGAANLTIKYFKPSSSFLEESISCNEIEKRLTENRLNQFPQDEVKSKFQEYESFIRVNNGVQKFASAKTYFSYQFNQYLQKSMNGLNLRIDEYKDDLARILKQSELSLDFQRLLNVLGF